MSRHLLECRSVGNLNFLKERKQLSVSTKEICLNHWTRLTYWQRIRAPDKTNKIIQSAADTLNISSFGQTFSRIMFATPATVLCRWLMWNPCVKRKNPTEAVDVFLSVLLLRLFILSDPSLGLWACYYILLLSELSFISSGFLALTIPAFPANCFLSSHHCLFHLHPPSPVSRCLHPRHTMRLPVVITLFKAPLCSRQLLSNWNNKETLVNMHWNQRWKTLFSKLQ